MGSLKRPYSLSDRLLHILIEETIALMPQLSEAVVKSRGVNRVHSLIATFKLYLEHFNQIVVHELPILTVTLCESHKDLA